MRLFLYLWLVTSIWACLAAAAPRTIAKRGSSSFVSSSKDGFSVNGSSLRFVGTNLYWLPTLDSNDDISNLLKNISDTGIKVIRIWAFNDVETIPESGTWFQLVQNGTTTINDGPNGLQKLDTVVQMAEQQGLYVIMSLTNNWNPVPNTTTSSTAIPEVLASVTSPRNTLSNDYGGMDLYVRQFGLQNHDDFYTNNQILTAFQNYTKQIVLRYLNSPAVFSWELANDARCNSTIPTSPTCTTQTITKWHAEMAAFIATIDSNHIVSAGTSGFQCPDCPKLYPITPTASPTPSPAPGKKRRSVAPLTKEQIIRQRAESRRQNRAAAKRAGTLKEDGIKIRGRWVSTATREVSSSIGPTTDGSSGVDSQDILNIPNIGFGSFQVFPDQNLYAPNDPNLSPVENKINSSLTWIQQSAQSAAAVGKPVVLNGFGLVTQSNLNDFVPFNMTYAPYASNTAVMDFTTRSGFAGNKRQQSTSEFADDSEQEQGYSSFLQMGNSAGLAGIMQYQWGSTGITQSSSAVQLDTTNSPAPAAATVDSPNDGYSIANNPAIQQILQQGVQAMAQDS
ncbi:glycoside hydrolase family 5 protein [Suillus bovinus]|uniref:glycoside hydrolase family 5 protein n=1 Tax=Suillus bovinus TaxID=48563 RepID=UPI001B85E501|nr:glycoside hydrolase family 5 protein [Suillus bovinus]KAG2137836.1 glycoside hydrolase family 5 protein [Suillus bovinus]